MTGRALQYLQTLGPAGGFWALLLGYCLGHALLRLGLSQGVSFDEAELLLDSQRLQWGYGSQPPLYIWLQALVFAPGPSLVAMVAVKYGLLAVTLSASYLTARHWLGEANARLATVGLLLLPQVGFESHRDLSHTVAATAMGAASLYALARLVAEPRPRHFALLGATLGLGALAKYSFGLFAVALVVAAWSLPPWRAALWRPQALVVPAVAGAIALPHYLWLLDHWQRATAPTVAKLQPAAPGGWAWLVGVGHLLFSLCQFVLPLVLVFALTRGLAPRPTPCPEARALLGRLGGVILVGLVGLVLVANVTYFKDSWLQPLFFWLPLYLLAFFPSPDPWDRRSQRFVAAAVLVISLYGAALVASAWDLDGDDKPHRFNKPAAALAAALAA
ncbi:MAG: glycosyltransferase family 39 protein, partial [Candidatus Competibacterales bacterium]